MPNPTPSNRLSPTTNIYFLSFSFGLFANILQNQVLYTCTPSQLTELPSAQRKQQMSSFWIIMIILII